MCGMVDKRGMKLELKDGFASSRVCCVTVPTEYVGRPYERFYHALTRHASIVPIGLLRDEVNGELGNKLPFVVTNPIASLLLRSTDLVYVLATQSQLK
jgi:hypothetical protein